MAPWLMAAALLALPPLPLPVSPASLGAGDLDGDGSAELVALLYWPVWGTTATNVATTPGAEEIDVVPALRQRRELRAYRITDAGLVSLAAPLEVGADLLGIAPFEPTAPLTVVTTRGLARIRLQAADPATDRPARLELVETLALDSAFAHVRGPLDRLPTLRTTAGRWLLFPTPRGFEAIAGDGKRHTLAATLRNLVTGAYGELALTIPTPLDLERDGTTDLLEIPSAPPSLVAYHRGLDSSDFAEPIIWEIGALLNASGQEQKEGLEHRLEEVVDVEGDGTLDLVISVQQARTRSLGQALKQMRGLERTLRFHRLLPDGKVESEPHRSARVIGFPLDIPGPDGTPCAFNDLDGDRRLDYSTITIGIGVFGVMRAAVTGTGRAAVRPALYRDSGPGYAVIADAMPELEVKFDMRRATVRSAFDIPGDMDGDGRADIVAFEGTKLQIYPSRADGRFASKPTREIDLGGGKRSGLEVQYRDLNSDGRLDVIAFAPDRERPEDEAADPTIPGLLLVHLSEPPR